jgi:HTH-type transcriptional regulator, sugar sensing transcriptional regulator
MKHIESLLEDIGLTDTEARIYLTGLAYESIGVQELSTKTSIKRPTIYHAMGTLMSKGLISERRIGSKIRFTMCPPGRLKDYVEEQKRILESKKNKVAEIIPLLEKRQGMKGKEEVSVVEYKGIEGVKMVFDIAFYAKSKYWDVIAPVNNFLRQYDEEYAGYYMKARKMYGITSRTLWEHKPGARKLSVQEVRDRNPRFMPKSMQGRFKTMMIIFDDKVAIFSPLDTLSAILITSKETAEMFRALFDGVWEVSEKYER